MVEANPVGADPQDHAMAQDRSTIAEVKYFQLDDDTSFAQFTLQMPDEQYQRYKEQAEA